MESSNSEDDEKKPSATLIKKTENPSHSLFKASAPITKKKVVVVRRVKKVETEKGSSQDLEVKDSDKKLIVRTSGVSNSFLSKQGLFPNKNIENNTSSETDKGLGGSLPSSVGHTPNRDVPQNKDSNTNESFQPRGGRSDESSSPDGGRPQYRPPGSGGQYRPPGSGGQYRPPGSGGQYRPPGSGGQYRPPGSGGGQYRPPGSGGGQYRPPGSGGGQYRPPGSGGQYRPPGSGGGQYRPPGSGGQYRPPGSGGQYRPPGSGGGQYRPPGSGGQYRPPGSGGGFRRNSGQGDTGSDRSPSSPPIIGKQYTKKVFKAKKTYGKERDSREKLFSHHQVKRKTQAQVAAVPSSIEITGNITVSQLAKKMKLKVSFLISKLMSMGMMAAINQKIDIETAQILAAEYNCEVKVVSLYDETVIPANESDEAVDMQIRSPVITVMGHVDHGKTRLLDTIRNTNVIGGEHGEITQHIGAYSVALKEGGKLTFLDTPGHEAFAHMRARGVKVTDIVVLVVSATEGPMAQTFEAIDHAQSQNVPVIVAINKVDLPDANIDLVKKRLSDHGLVPEEWGGQTMFMPISALKGDGVIELLQAIQLQAELLDLEVSFSCRAVGTVLDTRIDPGKGSAATVLVQKGRLRVGDPFVAGIYHGRVRAIYNDRGVRVEIALPSDPIELVGFSDGLPDSGDPFQVPADEKIAGQVASKRQELKRLEGARSIKKVTLTNLYDTLKEERVKELRVIIKGDVHGSIDALRYALEQLSNDEVRLTVLHAAAGTVVEQDVKLASASGALIIGFHVRPTQRAQSVANQEGVEIRKFNLIYEVVEDITRSMENLLSMELSEEVTGRAEVRKIFRASKIGDIAGCMVLDGTINRKNRIRVIRDGVTVITCKLAGLKHFTDDIKEVKEGFECGITLDGFTGIKESDILESFEIKETKRKMTNVSKKKKESVVENGANS